MLVLNVAVAGTGSLDLTEATKLKDVELWCNGPDIGWIVAMIQSAGSENLQGITIHSCPTFLKPTRETFHRQWENLDLLLVRLWTSRSIRPKFVCQANREWGGFRDLVQCLLPELARRGAVDMVQAEAP